MAIKKAFDSGVQYVGTYIIPHEKYHRIAMVVCAEYDESELYASELYAGKGIMDSDQYRIDSIPLDWVKVRQSGVTD